MYKLKITLGFAKAYTRSPGPSTAIYNLSYSSNRTQIGLLNNEIFQKYHFVTKPKFVTVRDVHRQISPAELKKRIEKLMELNCGDHEGCKLLSYIYKNSLNKGIIRVVRKRVKIEHFV